MIDANALGIPTYEADVECGMWCQGGSVKFYPTDHPHYTDIADVWVKGLDALELVNRLRATIERLREYAGHKLTCQIGAYDSWTGKTRSCDCGYDALLAETEEGK
jgi:hypothetical protein